MTRQVDVCKQNIRYGQMIHHEYVGPSCMLLYPHVNEDPRQGRMGRVFFTACPTVWTLKRNITTHTQRIHLRSQVEKSHNWKFVSSNGFCFRALIALQKSIIKVICSYPNTWKDKKRGNRLLPIKGHTFDPSFVLVTGNCANIEWKMCVLPVAVSDLTFQCSWYPSQPVLYLIGTGPDGPNFTVLFRYKRTVSTVLYHIGRHWL